MQSSHVVQNEDVIALKANPNDGKKFIVGTKGRVRGSVFKEPLGSGHPRNNRSATADKNATVTHRH
jgi:hypothetical protein